MTTKTMDQIERIHQMEHCLNLASQAIGQLSAALDVYAEAQKAIRQLTDYYGSDVWKQDFADDEAGRLPHHLKRGVLSEDGIWNVLEDNRELNCRMREVTERLADFSKEFQQEGEAANQDQ